MKFIMRRSSISSTTQQRQQQLSKQITRAWLVVAGSPTTSSSCVELQLQVHLRACRWQFGCPSCCCHVFAGWQSPAAASLVCNFTCIPH
jgi:hypothetical protein